MGEYKIIAVDLDGTVLNKDKKISAGNISAFKRCKEKGIYVIPVTGRPVSGLYQEYIQQLGCRYAINTNGAVAIDLLENKELINHTINIDTADCILDILDDFECYYSIFYKGYGYLTKNIFNNEVKKYKDSPLCEYIKNTRRVVENQREFLHSVEHCDNIYVTAKTTEIRDRIAEKIKIVKDVFYTCSDIDDVEIGGNCSKGKTLLQLGELLGVKRSEILSIGDSGNDLSMIQMAGCGVAMENASDLVKKSADFITKSCEDNGVAYAIGKYCNI